MVKSKSRRKQCGWLLLLLLILAFTACVPAAELQKEQPAKSAAEYVAPPVSGITTDDTLGSTHAEITKQLISIVNHNPELKAMLEKSIAQAKQINPDRRTTPAQTLDEYYEYIDWAARAMPWAILPDAGELYPKLYEQIDQSVAYFYFVNDQPLEELEGRGLYNNSIQYLEPYRSWLIEFTAQWGNYLNTTDSWCEEYYQAACEDERFNLGDETYESPDNWKTFNQFFARYLSSPDQRPIAAQADGSVVVSPADAQPQGVWAIDGDSNLVHSEGVNIKSGVFTSIDALLGDSKYRGAFANGTLTHTFLDVHDYHCYHFPVGGTVKEVRVIPGDDAAGGLTVWDAEKQKYLLLSGVHDWQMIETRGCVIVETEEYGLVAILPVGMSQISSVNFEDTVQVGAQVKKGDMMGCFLFGGSDIVMLFQAGVTFTLTAPQTREGAYRHINMGEEYGVLKSRE